MARTAGYLANIFTVPPLIFRFQFHPELLSEKKSFAYREVNGFGQWGFDRTRLGGALASRVTGAFADLKEMGSLLVGTRALEADMGRPRTFALDFALDARPTPDLPQPQAGAGGQPGSRGSGGRIEPSLAVLRSFMNPSWDLLDDVAGWLHGFKGFCPPNRPPVCMLKLGDIELDCVMTDLNIKITKFKSDLTPERAEVSLTLTEQTYSIATGLDTIGRLVEVHKSYGQLSGEDLVQVAPGAGLVQNVFEL